MDIKSKLITFFGTLGKFLAVLFKATLQKELVLVMPIARQIVAEVAADPGIITSSDRRNAAIGRIGVKLIPQQVAIGEDVIRLAIELAYQDFKASKPAPATAS